MLGRDKYTEACGNSQYRHCETVLIIFNFASFLLFLIYMQISWKALIELSYWRKAAFKTNLHPTSEKISWSVWFADDASEGNRYGRPHPF